MFKKRPTKAELRSQLSSQVDQFIKHGGKIQEVEMGETGLIDGRYNTHRSGQSAPKAQERTPVHGLLAQIDARRKSSKQKTSKNLRARTQKKKIIYDDFGEPVRTIWTDE